MSFLNTIKEMDQKFSWSFLGFLMAILFGGITLYLGFFREESPDLNFVITADSSVLDIKENLGSLDVLYEGESLSKSKKDLRIITFEVINQGDSAILSNFYDPNDPVGFSIIDGAIADDPSLLKASNNYLKEKLIITRNDDEAIVFSNVILEPKEFFEIKILVLHEVGKKPSIHPFGKVAGVNDINVLADYASSDSRSFLDQTFGGGIYSNAARLISFGLLFIFIMTLMIEISEKLDSIKMERRRKNILATFKDYDSDKISDKDSFFFDYYVSYGGDYVRRIHRIMSNSDYLNDIVKKKKTRFSKNISMSSAYSSGESMFIELRNEGFITIDNGVAVVDEKRLNVLTDFVNYLKRKGEFRSKKKLSYKYPEDIEVSKEE